MKAREQTLTTWNNLKTKLITLKFENQTLQKRVTELNKQVSEISNNQTNLSWIDNFVNQRENKATNLLKVSFNENVIEFGLALRFAGKFTEWRIFGEGGVNTAFQRTTDDLYKKVLEYVPVEDQTVQLKVILTTITQIK